MPTLIPSDPQFHAIDDVHRHELMTLQQLNAGLDADLTVYHGVHWSTATRSATRYGEIDFAVVHRDGRVLIIEQKNGALEETDQGIVKCYGNGRRKKVGDQLHRSIDALRQKFAGQHPREPGLFINYLLYCPDYRIVRLHGPGLDRTRVVDATQSDELASEINTLFADDESRNLPDPRSVHAFFCQTFDVVADIATQLAANTQRYTRLAGGLIDLFDKLEFTPRRLKIEGVAGCGKSMMASHYYGAACAAGKRPLYVCFNRVLRDTMAASFPGSVGLIETFHGLCRVARELAGDPVDFASPEAKLPRFWDELVESVAAIDLPNTLQFDVLIVDEGQDFRPYWFETLGLFMRRDYELLWLEDPNQDVFENVRVEVPATVVYRATITYRTPQTIAAFIVTLLGVPFECGNGLPGLGVDVFAFKTANEQLKLARARINALRAQGFGNGDILVLTSGSLQHSPFSGLTELAGVPLRQFTGKFDADSTPIYSDGLIRFDSVLRFKGGQSPAVLLVDTEAAALSRGNTDRILFCGMSRATVRLEILVANESPLADRLLGALSSATSSI